ncbi:hypothetical protein C8J56DRAFT_1013025 [Mycena floridula]|nr:hypothetical protein C8J56DRAFT_1013025 [Mycena floridula]
MSDSPAEPRRSQRDKKQPKTLSTVTAPAKSNRKRKHTDSDAEEEGQRTSEPDDNDGDALDDGADAGDEEDIGEDYASPQRNQGRKGKAKGTDPKPKGPPAAKKPRTGKAAPSKKGRKPKADTAFFDADQIAKDTKINSDNPLFNAILNPAAALQSTAEDFLESLNQDPGSAQAELINLIFRACGCNDTVSADEALDYDGAVDALDNFTEGLKQDDSPTYPLTSRLPVFKKFRTHLSEFFSRLILSAAEMGSLYTTTLIPTLQTWVVAMSSSQIRSFRHTATVVVMEVQSGLCSVAKAVEKEVEVVGRQREGEKKRKSKVPNNNKGLSAREKELESKSKEVNKRKTTVDGYIQEFLDSVFVHRYRDLDPLIRAECVASLGTFFKTYSTYFLNGSYLRYVGWLLSDLATPVRQAAVRCLQTVYSISGEAEHALTAVNHFTERFKQRMLEMAERDIDIAVRVGVLAVLGEIDSMGLLEEDERERLGSLVFCDEAKVRKGVAGFVKGVWEEWCEERSSEFPGTTNGTTPKGKKGKAKASPDSERVGLKGIASLLVKWGKALDKVIGDEEEDDDEAESSKRNRQITALAAAKSSKTVTETRTFLTVEALWDHLSPVSDWEGIVDILLLDHSAAGEENPSSSKARRGRKKTNGRKQDSVQDGGEDDEDDDTLESVQVDDAWRLEETEEGMLLEVLVAAISKARKEGSVKKGDEEAVANDITRSLIKALPRLFIKYQTDKNKIANVLILPTLINLDLYLEMRMINGYSNLWDDVIKQFTTHTDATVQSLACKTFEIFLETTSLSNTNSIKIVELEEILSTSLRDTVAGRDEIDIASFSDDEILTLQGICMRLAALGGIRNMTSWIEENEGGKQSSAWDILNALVERGRLGYKKEEDMIAHAMTFLKTHILWKAWGLTLSSSPSAEETRYRDALLLQRESLLDQLVEFAIGTQSNTVDGVKRAAFLNLFNLHLLFVSPQSLDGSPTPLSTVPLVMDDEIQYRCAGFIQAEVEQYIDTIDPSDGRSEDEGSDDDVEKKKRRKKNKNAEDEESDVKSSSRMAQDLEFLDIISTFIGGLRTGAIHIRHGAVLLAHYGRAGSSYDKFLKLISEILRDEGTGNNQGDILVSVVVQSLQEAFTLILDDTVGDEENAHQLAKLLATSFVIRGVQLSITRRLPSQYVVDIQLTLLTWIGKRLTEAQSKGNKKSLRKSILLFRALIPLLSGLQSRDALKIKAHLDQIVAQAKVEVSTTLKLWEPHRAYEKRLTAIMSKDKAPGAKGRKAKGAKANASDTEQDESEVEKLVEEGPEVAPPAQRTPRPRRPRNPAAETDVLSDVPTPKPRPKPRASKPKKAVSPAAIESSPPPAQTNGRTSPSKSPRKRARSEMDEDEEAVASSPIPAAEPEPPAEEPFRRKRVRH